MMVNNQREHIRKIRDDFQASQRVKDSLNNSIQALARDLYSKDTHFIFELIQNAEDNAYEAVEPSLSFLLVKTDPTGTKNSDGVLIIQNNEVGFSSENVDAICTVGKTTKIKIQGYIGEKGIGFKSVFRVTSNPHIFSNGYNFCIPEHDKETDLGYIVPQWIEQIPKGIDPSKTTIILPLDKADFGYGKIEKMLQDIEPETILFLSKLKEIKIKTDTGDVLTILKDDSKVPQVQILLEGIKQGESYSMVDEFLLFTKSFDRPTGVFHEKRNGIEKRSASIAFSLNEDKKSMGKIYAYLPVRSDTGLPFLVNGDFILPSSREEILDIPWNRWLMDCIAKLTAYALPRLKEKGLLTITLFEALASKLMKLSESSIFFPIASAVRDTLKEEELLPADDGTFVSARTAKLADSAPLREILTNKQLGALYQSDCELKWLSGKITKGLTLNFRSYLMKELEVAEIDCDGFVRKISESFLKNQPDDWFIIFYEYLHKHQALWDSPMSSNDSGGILRRKPILRLEDGSLVPPFDACDHPNAYLPPEHSVMFPVVRRSISNNQASFNFLKKCLGLEFPDEVADVIQNILPKYRENGTIQINDEAYQTDLKAIFLAFKTDSQQKKQHLLEEAQKTPFVKATNAMTNEIAFKKPGEVYWPTEDIRVYLSGNQDAWILSYDAVSERLNNEDRESWVSLGVSLLPRRIKHERRPSSDLRYSSREETIVNYDLDGLESFFERLQSISDSSEKAGMSRAVWRILIQCIADYRDFFLGGHSYFYYSKFYETFDADFTQFLRAHDWVLTKDGSLKRPPDICRDEIHPDLEESDELCRRLCIKPSLSTIGEDNQGSLQYHAQALGLDEKDLKNIELAKKYPDEFEQWKVTVSASKEKPPFPRRTVTNPDRRQEKLLEQLNDASDKEYEQRDGSVRTTRGTIDTALWLRNQYTNDAGQMICQICKKEMPFRKRDGEYYFEAVEALSKDYFTKEHEAQFLALCPLCAAMYKEFVKLDENVMRVLKSALMNSEGPEVSLNLGELKTSVQFVESHWQDIKTILQESDQISQ